MAVQQKDIETQVVLGLLFGDEGKGVTVDYLCRINLSLKTAVIRFSGGHNAGHTVVSDNKRHIFSQFGSGTFAGAPTFWSRYCTFHPPGLIREHQALLSHGAKPVIYVDQLAQVTTFYDIFYNRSLEKINNHGSCGVGLSATIERNEDNYKLHAQDILYPSILTYKLDAIKQYYLNKIHKSGNDKLVKEYMSFDEDAAKKVFLDACEACRNFVNIISESDFFGTLGYNHFVFEGSQGILLDQNYGFFPHVTRAHTTCKNAMEIIERNSLPTPEIFYVTRAYQTRHGNGPMTNEGWISNLIENKKETNITNEWQGNFRKGLMDIDLINYALSCDANFSKNADKHIVVTCMDQIKGNVIATFEGEEFEIKDWRKDFVKKIKLNLKQLKSLSFKNSDATHTMKSEVLSYYPKNGYYFNNIASITEEGYIRNKRKIGIWKQINTDTQEIVSIEKFTNGEHHGRCMSNYADIPSGFPIVSSFNCKPAKGVYFHNRMYGQHVDYRKNVPADNREGRAWGGIIVENNQIPGQKANEHDVLMRRLIALSSVVSSKF